MRAEPSKHDLRGRLHVRAAGVEEAEDLDLVVLFDGLRQIHVEEAVQRQGAAVRECRLRLRLDRLARVLVQDGEHGHPVVRGRGLDDAGREELGGGVLVLVGQCPVGRFGDGGPGRFGDGQHRLAVVLPLGEQAVGADPVEYVLVGAGEGELGRGTGPAAGGVQEPHSGPAALGKGLGGVAGLQGRLGRRDRVLGLRRRLVGQGAPVVGLLGVVDLGLRPQPGLQDAEFRVLGDAGGLRLTRGGLHGLGLLDRVGGRGRGLDRGLGVGGGTLGVLDRLTGVRGRLVGRVRGRVGVVGGAVGGVPRDRRRGCGPVGQTAGGTGGAGGAGGGGVGLGGGLSGGGGLGRGHTRRSGGVRGLVRGDGGVLRRARGGGTGGVGLARGHRGVVGGLRGGAGAARGVAGALGGTARGGGLGGVLGRGDGRTIGAGGRSARRRGGSGGGLGGPRGPARGGLRRAGGGDRGVGGIGRAAGGVGGVVGGARRLADVFLGGQGLRGRLLSSGLRLLRGLLGPVRGGHGLLRLEARLLALAFHHRDQLLDRRALLVAGPGDELTGDQEAVDGGGSPVGQGLLGVLLHLGGGGVEDREDLDPLVLGLRRVLRLVQEGAHGLGGARVQGLGGLAGHRGAAVVQEGEHRDPQVGRHRLGVSVGQVGGDGGVARRQRGPRRTAGWTCPRAGGP
ncbi:hypothetical protein RKD48_001643 [Streptomyces ambofaciens]